MRKLYVCDRKRCGDRCHYPDCRHTTDISHALNAPTFPNGFEKVKHRGNGLHRPDGGNPKTILLEKGKILAGAV